jgi:surface polysaccharide O-acyltransferase-like enzyme
MAIWTSIMCVSICISLLSFFRYKINSSHKFTRFLSENAYTVYIIHAPVLVVASISLALLILHPMLKFIVVLSLALSLCFIISQFVVRQIPGSKRVLG